MKVQDIIVIIISGLAIVISGIALYKSIRFNRKSFTLQILNNLFNEYRSVEMFKAIKELHRFYREKCKKCENIMIINYVNRFWDEEKEKDQENTLHFMRRLVSHYYQTAAMIYFNDILPKRWWYDIKATLDVKIIKDILIPLETKAVGQCVHPIKKAVSQPNKTKFEPLLQVKLMEKFYYEVEKLKPSWLKRCWSTVARAFSLLP